MPLTASRLMRLCLLAISTGGLVGCFGESREPTYAVSGKVTFKGKPVEKATLIFVPKEKGEPASAMTDEAGQYQLTTYAAGDGARPGQYQIKIMKYNVEAPDATDAKRNLSYEEEQKIYNDPSLRPSPPLKNLLPNKYENEKTSGLEHTVGEAPSTKDIVIE